MDEWRVDPDAWDDAVGRAAGPQLVVAGPGAGKTEFLVRRAVHLVDHGHAPPDGVLLLSFSRRSAADLRRRVEDRLARSFTAVAASTFHSLGFRLLEAHAEQVLGWLRMPTLLTGPEQVDLVHRLLATDAPAAWPRPLRDLLGTQTLAREVADFLLRCQEQLIDPDALDERAAGRADWRPLGGFFRRYLAELAELGRIDYGTLQADTVRLLDDSDVAAAVAGQHPFILVDEYQDTTVAQATLLERLYRPHRNLTVAGDPYQSIYSFRGTEVDNIADFPARFRDAGGAPARRLVLTTSFRVPAAILETAVRVTAGGDLPGGAGPVVPAGPGGAVETYGFDQQTHQAEWIAAETERMHLVDRIPYGRMAVLVRSKRTFLPELSRALDRRHIPHDRPDARLVDHPAVRLVLDCVISATDGGAEQTKAVQRLLLGPLFGLPLGAVRDLVRSRARRGWPAILRADVEGGAPLADLLDDPRWAAADAAAEGFWALWSRLPQFAGLVETAELVEHRAAWASLSQILHGWWERDPGATLADYLRMAEEEEFEATPLLGFRPSGEDRLTLTTIHQAKGLEFDVVFVADANEGVFPDLRPRESLLGSRHLSTSQPAQPAAYARFRLQEEMRLAYTAMCRASRRVVWTATAGGPNETQSAPSRFLALAAGTDTVEHAARAPDAGDRPVVTPSEAEAWLRRLLRNPAEPAALREAALDCLADGPAWGLRPATDFAGVAARGPDDGLLPDGYTLSPSQAESYLNCGYRYALERRLHVGDETNVYMAFGTLIHDVLEVVEAAAMERGDRHAGVEEALACLDNRWDPVPFGGDPWSEGWRAHAEATLRHLYAHWPEEGRPVALEHPLELELDGITWRGRADRIEEVDGAVRIVDYKTSKSPMGVEEAATSVQLGFYVVAAAADPAIRAHGEPSAAELWYPAQHRRRSLARRRFDPARSGEVLGAIGEAAAGIAAEDWETRPGPRCERCRVRIVCPAWPEGREAYQA